ncbi:MAG: peptidyl-tRNA hydrolase [Candidatus Aenigmarchaeota archaeon]|nr:peptidyl-tRNA hydrolase [Candidatus Aenigmarchaeota archaeon]
MYKQVIVVRKDLNLSPGKLAAQVAHASLGSWRKSNKLVRGIWRLEGEKKVVLSVNGKKGLLDLKKKAEKMKLPHVLISDAGRTELPSGTITCLGIGPAKEKDIDKITGSLPLWK